MVHLDILQVPLDVPQRAGTGLQLGDLIFCQGHVDHAGHASTVQHAGETQIHLLTDAIHALYTMSNRFTVCTSNIQLKNRDEGGKVKVCH